MEIELKMVNFRIHTTNITEFPGRQVVEFRGLWIIEGWKQTLEICDGDRILCNEICCY